MVDPDLLSLSSDEHYTDANRTQRNDCQEAAQEVADLLDIATDLFEQRPKRTSHALNNGSCLWWGLRTSQLQAVAIPEPVALAAIGSSRVMTRPGHSSIGGSPRWAYCAISGGSLSRYQSLRASQRRFSRPGGLVLGRENAG